MKLDKIQIKNFRSIEDETIEIDNKCIIFVGKNEAGKSNILKAISGGLDKNSYEISAKDKRKRGSEEGKIEDFFIKYYFSLNSDEIKAFADDFKDDYYENLFKIGDKVIDNKDLIEKYFSSGVYVYDLKNQKACARYFAPPKTLELNKTMAKITVAFQDENGSYAVGEIINLNEIKIPSTNYEILKVDFFLKKYIDYLIDKIEESIPEVILWKYDEKYLLPSEISLDGFIEDSKQSIPLKNIFHLAGYNNIKTAFQEALEQDGDYINLFDIVSKTATKNFSAKWPDLKEIQFVITKDGEKILTKVKGKASYDLKDRSDGFKQFVSILLMLSSRIETGFIENAIILVDEPDRSLYPSGAKYLRNELIKMSKNNLVFYSTHSPFMIDKTNIERHLIVKKDNNDITHLEPVSNSNFREDEVLLNAIGTSNFEFIKEKNIIFEGWTDNKLFKAALTSNKRIHKSIINFFKDFGITYATGAKDIKSMTPLVLLANKDIIIFTDSDDASRSAKKDYIENNGYKCEQWYTFEDLGGRKDQTVEDYVKLDLINMALQDIEKQDINIANNTNNLPIMQFLHNKTSKDEKRNFKDYIAKNVTSNDIKDEYFEILKKLIEKIENIEE